MCKWTQDTLQVMNVVRPARKLYSPWRKNQIRYIFIQIWNSFGNVREYGFEFWNSINATSRNPSNSHQFFGLEFWTIYHLYVNMPATKISQNKNKLVPSKVKTQINEFPNSREVIDSIKWRLDIFAQICISVNIRKYLYTS